jgi:hypothetical protein
MAWSGGTYRKGNYSTNGWTGDASLGIGIEAGRHDTQDDDFMNGINQTLNKDGSNSATGNLNIGSNRLTNVAAGTARTDAINLSQVQDSSLLWGGTSGGAANAQTLTLAPIITAYAAGQRYSFLAGFTNTAAATLNINGVGAKNIFNAATGAAIGAGEIVATRAYEVIYDGTQFLLLNDVTPIQNGDYIWLGTTGGTATVMTASATPAITAYKAGQKFRMIIGAGLGSTGSVATAATININGIGAKNIVNNEDSTNPTLGTWVAAALMELIYDGTNFRITNSPGGRLTWTPTVTPVTGSNGGTTIVVNYYEKRGKLVYFNLAGYFALNTASTTAVTFTIPVRAFAHSQIAGNGYISNATTVSGWSTIQSPVTNNTFAMSRYDSGNLLVGTVYFGINGSYYAE